MAETTIRVFNSRTGTWYRTYRGAVHVEDKEDFSSFFIMRQTAKEKADGELVLFRQMRVARFSKSMFAYYETTLDEEVVTTNEKMERGYIYLDTLIKEIGEDGES